MGDTVVLRVAPMDSRHEVLAGGLDCVWSLSDATVAEIVGDETDNVIEIQGGQVGTATLQVNLAGLSNWVTIEVGG